MRQTMGMRTMVSGYCYELAGDMRPFEATNDHWEILAYEPNGSEELVDQSQINGDICFVFKCQDGKYRAQGKNKP